MRAYRALIPALLLACAAAAQAWPGRSTSARAQFQRDNPCPANGKKTGACQGYVIDHIKPLCAGGEDAPGNMQWQTVVDAKVKDREERKQCRRLPSHARGCENEQVPTKTSCGTLKLWH